MITTAIKNSQHLMDKALEIEAQYGPEGLADWVTNDYIDGPEEMFMRLHVSVLTVQFDPEKVKAFRMRLLQWAADMPPGIKGSVERMLQAVSDILSAAMVQAAIEEGVELAKNLGTIPIPSRKPGEPKGPNSPLH